jgi:CCR4-NOT transcription complex subunit 2
MLRGRGHKRLVVLSDIILSLSFFFCSMLYPSFMSAFNKVNQEPEFSLPMCYQVQPLPDPRTKIAQFSDETLFYIFYSFTRDAIQDSAAQEL